MDGQQYAAGDTGDQREQGGQGNKLWGILLGLVVLAVIGGIAYAIFKPEAAKPVIESYEACVRDGNYVTKTSPATCVTTDGKRFTEPVQPEPMVPQPASEGGGR